MNLIISLPQINGDSIQRPNVLLYNFYFLHRIMFDVHEIDEII